MREVFVYVLTVKFGQGKGLCEYFIYFCKFSVINIQSRDIYWMSLEQSSFAFAGQKNFSIWKRTTTTKLQFTNYLTLVKCRKISVAMTSTNLTCVGCLDSTMCDWKTVNGTTLLDCLSLKFM